MRSWALTLSLLAACATSRTDKALRISATHYQSMMGVAVGSGPDAATCMRDTITGSHILRWYCRFDANGYQYQLGVPVHLDLHVR